MIQYADQSLEDETLDLSGKDAFYLGPNLSLMRCNVVLRVSPSALTLTRVRFLKCRIETKRKLSNFRWLNAWMEQCSFIGTFSGCDFGNWPSHFEPGGGIQACDFSGATLDGCRFVGCDASTIVFPTWPCFTILDPVNRIDEFRSVDWPGDMKILIETIAHFPPETVAVTYLSSAIEKQLGAAPDRLRSVLERLDGVTT